MRISDWSSDVCSSDLSQSRRASDGSCTVGLIASEARRSKLEAERKQQADLYRTSLSRLCAARRPSPWAAHRYLRSIQTRQDAAHGNDRAQPRATRHSDPGHHSGAPRRRSRTLRSEEHTSELQSLMRISYAFFCLKTKKNSLSQY